MSLEDLRARYAELQAMQDRLAACMADVQRATAQAKADLDEASRQEIRLRTLGEVRNEPGGERPTTLVSLEQIRDAVVTLKHFTMSELAAELGCSTSKARQYAKRVEHLIGENGHLGSTKMYAYIEPAGPGAAFEAQQAVTEPVADLASARSAEVDLGASLSSVACKELRPIVREALRAGWRLSQGSGKHHMRLVRGGQIITLPSTPRNAGNAAKSLRRQVRQAS